MLSWLSRQAPGSNTGDRSNKRHWWNRGGNRDDRPPQRDDDDDRRTNDSDDRGGNIVIGIQHIPAARGDNMPPDPKPYWVISEPYRSRELTLLHRLGVRHMLVGHWHVGNIFERDGITWHVAPSTSRLLPWSTPLGFAMHTISPNGDVKTEFVSINSQP
jgi:hypothetical protein